MSWSLLIPWGVVLFLLAFLSWWQPRALLAQVQWSHAMWNLEEDADRFYARLFTLLEDRLAARPLPFSSLSIGPCCLFATRTVLGGEALYLQANYRHLTYYVYACPMPGGLYVSTWLFSKMAGWEDHPLLKWLLLWRLYRMTLFGFDALEMFHLTVHGAVMDLLDDYVRERGLAPLDEVARRPVLHGFYARRKGVTSLPPASTSGTEPAVQLPAPPRLPFEAPQELPLVPPAPASLESAISPISPLSAFAPGLPRSPLPFERTGKTHDAEQSP